MNRLTYLDSNLIDKAIKSQMIVGTKYLKALV